jgi:hypothetical protein
MMCAISPGARLPPQGEEVQKDTSGLTANPDSKGDGDRSMPPKRKAYRRRSGRRSARPARQGESRIARTSVSSEASVLPPTTTSLSGAIVIERRSRRRSKFLRDGRREMIPLKGADEAPKSCSIRLASREYGIAYRARAPRRRSHRNTQRSGKPATRGRVAGDVGSNNKRYA